MEFVTKGTKRTAEEFDYKDYDEIGISQTRTLPQVIRRPRGRHNVILPPFVPKSTSDFWPQEKDSGTGFNVFKAILRHPTLFFQFALRLPPDTMLDLYAIDKEFHYRFNIYSHSLIHDYAVYHASDASYIFSFVMFPNLCISDPMLKPMDGRPHLSRDIPSLRWTKMVLYRDSTIREILTLLALEGHRVPKGTEVMLMKFWVLMETRTQAMREAFLKQNDLWAETDIVLFHLFLVKLDMRFSCPVKGQGICELSHMLLSQKSLSTLRDVLSGKLKFDYDDIIDYVVRTYLAENLDLDMHPWLNDEAENGVPETEWGAMQREHWHRDGSPMDHVVDLILMEGIKRGLNIQQYLLDFLTFGYVDLQTGQNVPVPTRYRGSDRIVEPTVGWPHLEERKNLIDRLDSWCGIEKEKTQKFCWPIILGPPQHTAAGSDTPIGGETETTA